MQNVWVVATDTEDGLCVFATESDAKRFAAVFPGATEVTLEPVFATSEAVEVMIAAARLTAEMMHS
jgi:hypothetical protein